jgi:iron complex outermembrane recepter protein
MVHSSKHSGLRASVSLLALATAWTVAMPALADDVETIVVSGYRHSLETTEGIKRSSVGLVEAVSSEDIGKLPDVSIAESLSRLPGLAGQRVDGRSQVIAIRGLSPDFAGTTLNGREQVSTGDNRGVEFDQYPSEILSGVIVYKTPDAKLLGQGLSGTVDLKTVRPLDYDEMRFAVGIRGEVNSMGKVYRVSPYGSRFNISYIDQFLNGKLGVAVGYAHLDSPFQQKHYTAWWWGNPDTWGATQPGKDPDAVMQQGSEVRVSSQSQVRDGLAVTLEFKPNEHIHSVLDMYYSNFNQREYMNGAQWESYPNCVKINPNLPESTVDSSLPCAGDPNRATVSLRNAVYETVGGIKLVKGGAWYNMRVLGRNDYNTRVDVLSAAAWRNEYTNANFSLALDLSYSGAKRNSSQLESYVGTHTPESNLVFDVPLTNHGFPVFTPTINYADPSVIGIFDTLNYGHEARLETPQQKDTIQAARLEAKYHVGHIISDFEAGIGFQTRYKKKTSSVYFLDLSDKTVVQPISSDLLYRSPDLSFAGFKNGVMAYNVGAVTSKYLTRTLRMSGDDYKKDFSVKENVVTGYVMANLDSDIGFATLRGNVGAQLIHTDQSSRAFNIDNAPGKPNVPLGDMSGNKSYYDFLPSINLSFDFDDGNIVRLGIAKTMARPRVDDMRAAASAGVSDTTPYKWSGSGGNPQLKPWRADSIDIAYEHYFGKASYVSIAGFYKNLKTYIYNQTIPNYDFSNFTNTTNNTPISNFGEYSTPANGKGGYMRGAEISAQLDGTLFTDYLDGFGSVLSFSWTDSSIKPDGPGTSTIATLPGLSKAVASGTLYYEKDGISVRVSERYRSDFRGEITTNFAQRSYTRILAEMITDVQIGYDFADGRLNGLSVVAQVENLFNTPYRTYQDDRLSNGTNEPREYNLYGRTILLGLNYKL